MAEAVRQGVASRAMVVGGEGHTTERLREQAARGTSAAADRAEADIFVRHLRTAYDVEVDLVERASTNCGSNVTNALAVLEAHQVPHDRVVLIQDATMQRRMGAGWRHERPRAQVVNFAAYQARVRVDGGEVRYAEATEDVWPLERFASMLLGEIARLRDDAGGSGALGPGSPTSTSRPRSPTPAGP